MIKWLVILLVVVVAAGVARWAWTSGWPHLDPPAVAGSAVKNVDRANWEQASGRLTQVLIKSFPSGSASAEVSNRLHNQGFTALKQCPSPTLQKVGVQGFTCSQNWDPDHALHYSWGPRNPCQQDMAVFWTDDSSGRLTSIEGQYSCN